MDAAPVIKSKLSLQLDLPPSCIQFCPAHPSFFIVGTYNLEKDETQQRSEEEGDAASKPQSRNGTLLVFTIVNDDLQLVQTVQQPSAILDLRFHPTKQNILAVVSSTATLAVFSLDPKWNSKAPLQELATSVCSGDDELDQGTLFLQCNWHPVDEHQVGVTTSTGLARLLTLNERWEICRSTDLQAANTLEAWSIAFTPHKEESDQTSPFTVYCGGDDSALRYAVYPHGTASSIPSDSKTEESIEHLYEAAVPNQHTAGVTAIYPLSIKAPDGGRMVITGSYDDHIRLFSIHDLDETYGLKRVKLLSEDNLGGGVWRLDLIDVATEGERARIRILVSCMHAGARIVEYRRGDDGEWACEILARFEEHKSMNYGSDFVRNGENGTLRCVSTSFYDRLLCVWDHQWADSNS